MKVHGCILLGAALTTHCSVEPRLFATDRPRCTPKPWAIKPPHAIRK